METSPRAIDPRSTRRLIIVAGPTASGKSALALELARRFGGTIINADAMQCYADWRIITARPTAADEAAAPHRLYGVRALDQPVDAAWWCRAARDELDRATLPILCGGTGLYLGALINGLAPIPDPGPAARAQARHLLAANGAPWLHAWLTERDPPSAARLQPTDSQRLARAAELWLGTGHGPAHYHALPRDRLTGFDIRLIRLDPPRETLHDAITARFAAMLGAGALDEVRAIHSRSLDPGLPGLRAHGVPELMAHLAGTLTLDQAATSAVAATFAYTKRQRTWFRHQALAPGSSTQIIHARFSHAAQFSESFNLSMMSYINEAG